MTNLTDSGQMNMMANTTLDNSAEIANAIKASGGARGIGARRI
jgi:hypothetical protein